MPIVSDLRGLPRATASERWVLGCVLMHEDCRPKIFQQLDAADFFEERHQAIFTVMLELQRADGTIGTTLLAERLRAPGSNYHSADNPAFDLLELAHEVATSIELDAHIRRLRAATAGRAICYAVNDARNRVAKGGPADEVASELIQDLSNLQRSYQRLAKLVSAAEVERREMQWLWPAWLPIGALTIFDGDPGCGKTQVACDLAARVSAGRTMPLVAVDAALRDANGRELSDSSFGETRLLEHGNVLMLTGEDSHDTTTRPRLEAAGADLNRVLLWPDEDDPIRMPSGVERLSAVVASHNVRLLVIDPITAYLDDSVNTNRDADVRRALRPLIAMAQQHGTAVLLIRHLNKDSSKAALYRGGGSIGFVAAARAAWVVARDPDSTDKFVLAMNKCNIARHPRSITYQIEAAEGTSRIRWEAECDFQAGELLSGKQRGTKQADAEQIIRQMLADGPRAEQEVRRACQDAGIGHTNYKNARSNLGVRSAKSSMDRGWLLELPQPILPIEGVSFPDPLTSNPFVNLPEIT